MKTQWILIVTIFALSGTPMDSSAAPRNGYTQEYCDTVKAEIEDLKAKIKLWKPSLTNANVLYMPFWCNAGEGLESCMARCEREYRCIYIKNMSRVLYTYPADIYRNEEGDSKLQQARDYSDRVKKEEVGGRYGYVDAWEAELAKDEEEYAENCSGPDSSEGGGTTLFGREFR